jgi:hypothetical protein
MPAEAGAETVEVPTSHIRRFDTHRLIPTKFIDSNDSVLSGLVENEEDLKALFDLESATNRRLIGEQGGLPAIGVDELVFGVPGFRIINAAFTNARPAGSRFNGPDRGAWYASYDHQTALAEIIYHKNIELAEINCFENSTSYSDFLADFNCEFHDLREDNGFLRYLNPSDYRESQKLAAELYDEGSLGLIYPSVRHDLGINVVCFRPALVGNVIKGASYHVTWNGTSEPEVLMV